MDIFALLIGMVILAGAAYYISRPLLRPAHAATVSGLDVQSLEAQRDSLYTQIKELDQDHETGKVNDEDYTRLRAALVAQAAEVLKQIDRAGARSAPAPGLKPAAVAGGDAEVEALIAARRKTQSAAARKTSDADLEAAIVARRRTPVAAVATAVAEIPDPPVMACPKCGRPVKADDAFCAKCGTALQPQPAP